MICSANWEEKESYVYHDPKSFCFGRRRKIATTQRETGREEDHTPRRGGGCSWKIRKSAGGIPDERLRTF